MSKKVVHLSDDAHELAKLFCKESGMKMSDWVAMLIKRAVEPPAQVPAPPPAPVMSHPAIREVAPRLPEQRPASFATPSFNVSGASNPSLPKKKPMLRELSSDEDQVPVYAQPPFWARKSS
ncbi:MAG: hypothetical protein ACAI38_14525 [Myxococcota bacterium]|nr:hypothetical protein [Myxococcota bacterium]